MLTSRRAFLTGFTSLMSVSPWRFGWDHPPHAGAHDPLPSAATVSGRAACPAPEMPPWLETWTRLPRHPVMGYDLDWLQEWTSNELHHEQTLLRSGDLSGQSRASFIMLQERLTEISTARRLLGHIASAQAVRFTYHGGSQPHTARSVHPVLLFTVPDEIEDYDTCPEMDPTYLLAHCLTRQAPRTFRLSKITDLKPQI